MLYQFEKGKIEYYDGLNLTLIQPDTSVLRFKHIKHLCINKSGISFHAVYIPESGEIVTLKYTDKEGNDCKINVIYLGEDDKRIEVYCNSNIPEFNNLNISTKYISKKDYEFIPLSGVYYQAIITEFKEKGYVYDRDDIEIYKYIWKPEDGDIYSYITSFGEIGNRFYTNGDIQDELRISIGNCFQTKEQAEEAREAFVKWFKAYRQNE